MSNFSEPIRQDRASQRRHVTVVAILICAMSWIVGCDSRQNLARSGAFQVSASANSTAVVPHGWRRTKSGWEHTSTWNLAAIDSSARAARPTLQEWIDRTSKRNPTWTNDLFSSIRSLSPITIALIQIALIGLIFEASNRIAKTKAS